MTPKKMEKFKRASLRNLSNNLYKYLKTNNEEERVYINKTFNFDDYKELIRFELIEFSYNFISLYNSESLNNKLMVSEKAKTKNYVDEILDDEELLNNYTIFKIQQFVNRVAKNVLENGYRNFKEVSKNDKYIEYKDIKIDVSDYIGFVTPDKISSYLYREFDLKRMKSEEYREAFALKNTDAVKNDPSYLDEVNKLLFKAAINIDEKNHVVIDHPVKDDDSILRYIKEGFVANRTPKRILKKLVIEPEDEDFIKKTSY